MVPKIIHCCWLSGEKKPRLARKCRASWEKFASDWEIKEWTFDDLGSLGLVPEFVKGAIDAKKWAFASDWVRFAAVEKFGGVYLDYDVELIKPIDDLVAVGGFFALSRDEDKWVDPGLGFAAEKGDAVIGEIVRKYESMSFDSACHLSQTCPEVVNPLVKGRVRLLPAAVFNPMGSCAGKLKISGETRAIHHYAASWFNWKQQLAYKILPRLGIDVGKVLRWFRG